MTSKTELMHNVLALFCFMTYVIEGTDYHGLRRWITLSICGIDWTYDRKKAEVFETEDEAAHEVTWILQNTEIQGNMHIVAVNAGGERLIGRFL